MSRAYNIYHTGLRLAQAIFLALRCVYVAFVACVTLETGLYINLFLFTKKTGSIPTHTQKTQKTNLNKVNERVTNNILVTYGALQVLYCIVLYCVTCSRIRTLLCL